MPMTPPKTSGCQVRVGFFMLRDCGEPVHAACTECGRDACGVHLVEDGRCIECAAKAFRYKPGHEKWAWYARHTAVDKHGLRPFYDGTMGVGDGYYDAWDLRPLRAVDDTDWHDDPDDRFDS